MGHALLPTRAERSWPLDDQCSGGADSGDGSGWRRASASATKAVRRRRRWRTKAGTVMAEMVEQQAARPMDGLDRPIQASPSTEMKQIAVG
ncbi:hypothetical protein ACLOJK_022422 [Asimina triloba]